MLSNHKKCFILLAASAFSVFVSCQKEEEPQNTGFPVTLKMSGTPEKLYNEITLGATVNANNTVDRVEFYANDHSIGQATSEPYELTWNTKEVEDGPYILKAVAFDASGNTGETSQEITVKNTLFTVRVEDGHFPLYENPSYISEKWFFLSDKNGNIVGEEKQALNGENLHWERPSDFYSDTIYMTRLVYTHWTYQQRTYTSISANTFTDFPLDEISLRAHTSADSIGRADLTVENNFSGTDLYQYETQVPTHRRSGRISSPNNPVSYSVSMSENSQVGFSTFENEIGMIGDQHMREKFYRMDELQAGNSYTFHTDEYTPMQEQIITFPFDARYTSASTVGYPNTLEEGGYQLDNTYTFRNGSKELKLFSADIFPHIRTSISGRAGNKDFYLSTMSQAPDVITLPKYSVNIPSADQKNIEVTTNGSFDIGRHSWSTEITGADYVSLARYLYFRSESGNTYVLPEIPASLLERYPALSNQLEPEQSMASDYNALNSYEDVLKYWYTDSFNGFEYMEYSRVRIYPENEGGRLLPAQDATPIRKEMEEQDLRARGVFLY